MAPTATTNKSEQTIKFALFLGTKWWMQNDVAKRRAANGFCGTEVKGRTNERGSCVQNADDKNWHWHRNSALQAGLGAQVKFVLTCWLAGVMMMCRKQFWAQEKV